MIKKHPLIDLEIDISDAMSRHSADIVIPYKKVGSQPVYLGYFLPKKYDPQKEYPAFVFVHGGGWVSHMIFEDQEVWAGDYLGYLARYYADKGFISVSIDYRLVLDSGQKENYGLINCYEDCCDAMDYIQYHAKEYGIDASQMYLLGESAGGYLAAALATFHHDKQYKFKKVFLVNAITHLYDKWKYIVPIQSKHSDLKNLTVKARTDFLSPLKQLDKSCGEIFLFHGECDPVVNIEHSQLFYDKMATLKIPCELHIFEDTIHAFLLAEYYDQGLQACKNTISIIDTAIEN